MLPAHQKGDKVKVRTGWQIGWSKRRPEDSVAIVEDFRRLQYTNETGVRFEDGTFEWVGNAHMLLSRIVTVPACKDGSPCTACASREHNERGSGPCKRHAGRTDIRLVEAR